MGFPSAGTLSVIYKNSTVGVVSYTSKTVNQFFGVDGVTSVIGDSAEIDQNTFAYSAGLEELMELESKSDLFSMI